MVCNRDPVIAQALLQDDLDNVSAWCIDYKLTVNCDKSHVLWCRSDQDRRDFSRYDIALSGRNLGVVLTTLVW